MWSELRSLTSLVFPLACIGCGAPQCDICPNCWRLWRSTPIRSRLDAIPLAFTARYQPKVQHFVLAAKENGSKVARAALAESITASLHALVRENLCSPICLVPIPSHRSVIRKRGRNHSLLLAQEVARRFGPKAQVAPILRVARAVSDQTGLTHPERAANLFGAFSVDSRGIGKKVGAHLVMVDDVITSGASLREGARALTDAGLPPSAAVVACASARFLPIRLPLE